MAAQPATPRESGEAQGRRSRRPWRSDGGMIAGSNLVRGSNTAWARRLDTVGLRLTQLGVFRECGRRRGFRV